jgi:aminoglycoside 6'-N-acetyltransferase I
MIIEQISTDNIRYLVPLVLELWPDCDYEEENEYFHQLIDSDTQTCFLAKEKDHYVAFIQLAIRNDYVEGADELPVAYVEGIYVKSDYQKRGIARNLIVRAEEWARRKGLKQLASDTELSNNASIAFHKSLGFTEAGRIVCFVKNI